MKILKTGALSVLLSLCFISSNAQKIPSFSEPDYNKPKAFADLPQKMKLDVQTFEKLLLTDVGNKINLLIAPGFNLQGVVVSKSDPIDVQSKTVVIRATNREGATFTISRINNTDGTFSYNGRILSFKHSDAYEITQEEGQFVMVKRNLYDLFNE